MINTMKKSIFIFADALSAGGVSTFLKYFSKDLYDNSCSSYIFCFNDSNKISLPNVVVISNNIGDVRSMFLNVPKLLFWNYQIFREVLIRKPAKLVFQLPLSTAYLLPLIIINLLFLKVPMIYQFHGSYSLEMADVVKRMNKHSNRRFIKKKISIVTLLAIEKLLLRLFSTIVCFSAFAKELLHERLGVNYKKIIVTKPPYEDVPLTQISKFNSRSAKCFDGVNLIYSGRIEPRKGVFELLNVCKLLQDKNMRYSLTFITNFQDHYEPNILRHFFSRLNELKIAESVLFYNNPSWSFISSRLSESDLCMMLSLDLETFGYACLESLASGCPVICLEKGGALREVIKDSVNGYVIDSNSLIEKSVVKVIQKHLLLSDKEKYIMRKQAILSAQQFAGSTYARKVILN